ncbi:MAG: hypothetical protein IIB95_06995 [Candidatus Marinimicrobia bacterium]|nr:hypothetical protein [Candidatus Neomarinimicrobiota bacterium]
MDKSIASAKFVFVISPSSPLACLPKCNVGMATFDRRKELLAGISYLPGRQADIFHYSPATNPSGTILRLPCSIMFNIVKTAVSAISAAS